jgi:hypothetical protein
LKEKSKKFCGAAKSEKLLDRQPAREDLAFDVWSGEAALWSSQEHQERIRLCDLLALQNQHA